MGTAGVLKNPKINMGTATIFLMANYWKEEQNRVAVAIFEKDCFNR
jgi:hypothetical protein